MRGGRERDPALERRLSVRCSPRAWPRGDGKVRVPGLRDMEEGGRKAGRAATLGPQFTPSNTQHVGQRAEGGAVWGPGRGLWLLTPPSLF